MHEVLDAAHGGDGAHDDGERRKALVRLGVAGRGGDSGSAIARGRARGEARGEHVIDVGRAENGSETREPPPERQPGRSGATRRGAPRRAYHPLSAMIRSLIPFRGRPFARGRGRRESPSTRLSPCERREVRLDEYPRRVWYAASVVVRSVSGASYWANSQHQPGPQSRSVGHR